MKKVSIIRKLASRILKEYSNIFSILSSWKYESRLSYFRTLYQQRENCFGEQSKELEKEWKNGIDELNGRSVICCSRKILRNCFIVLLSFKSYLSRYRFCTFCLMHRLRRGFEQTGK